MNNNEILKDKDILLYEDYYVVLNKDSNDYVELDKIKKVGILESDNVDLKKYFGDKVEYVVYEDIDNLQQGFL